MSCHRLIPWDGRDWRPGQRFRVPPNPARPRDSGFAGVLLDLRIMPGGPHGPYAIIWYEDEHGDRLSTGVRQGEMQPEE